MLHCPLCCHFFFVKEGRGWNAARPLSEAAGENPDMRRLYTGAKKAIVSHLERHLEDGLSKRLAPYLAIGVGEDGKDRSVVDARDLQEISLANCFVRPSAVDALLAENELPLQVAVAHVERVVIAIPWTNLSSGDWIVEVQGVCTARRPVADCARLAAPSQDAQRPNTLVTYLRQLFFSLTQLTVVVHPLERKDWHVEDVRRVKQHVIDACLKALLKRLTEMAKKRQKRSLVQSLMLRFLYNGKPGVNIRNVHLRFERFGDVAMPFALGFIMPRA